MNKIKLLGVALCLIFVFCLPLYVKNIYWQFILSLTWINVLLASSLRTIILTGEISLGTAGFMLIGAYSSALMAVKLGLSVWLTMLLGGMIAAAFALILSYPILRTKGVYFAILTLLVAEIFRLTMWYLPNFSGGPAGLANIPTPGPISIFGITTLSFDTKTSMYYLILVIVSLCLLVLYRLERFFGFTWMAIKQNDDLAESVGIDVFGYKLIAFVIGCFFAGIAGALFAHFMGLLTTDGTAMFGILTSIYVLIYVVIGGQDSFVGPVIGAVVLTLLPEFFRPLKQYQPILFGALVILIIFCLRSGLTGLFSYFLLWSKKAFGAGKSLRVKAGPDR